MHRKPRILIVDDEESIRFSFHCFLTEMGFDVDVASNVEDAMDILVEQEFDVAVVDKTFPGGRSGIDLISHLKSVQPFCQPIIISGYPMETSNEEEYNFFTSLYKPVRQEELCVAVEKAAIQALKVNPNHTT